MNLESLLWSFCAVLVMAALFLYFQRKQRISDNNTKLYLDNLAQSQGLTFSRFEFWGSGYVIGMDTAKGILCYSNNITAPVECTRINLADVASCTVINNHRDVNSNRIIDQIKLGFTFRDAHPHSSLLFYDREASLHFENELITAEKWKSIICAYIGLDQLVGK
ncbi:hypothetical protein ACXYMU_10000 [Pontibacter sp. CAU 1760]